jgi:hypothetical protein
MTSKAAPAQPVVIGSSVASRPGAAVKVQRIELSSAGVTLLTAKIGSISSGASTTVQPRTAASTERS